MIGIPIRGHCSLAGSIGELFKAELINPESSSANAAHVELKTATYVR